GDLTRRLISGDGCPADEYLLLADFESYKAAHERVGKVYRKPEQWNRMSLINIARSGIFAADRSICDYAETIWDVPHRG
ncbi:MAG: glycogen/starch/alpha-glucan phosphorylase, partial [Oscillospiraceae bacterium]|nr:glycogen/starch/alpha-glucan phosphorylase [Oscillospiraceae bacterium]